MYTNFVINVLLEKILLELEHFNPKNFKIFDDPCIDTYFI